MTSTTTTYAVRPPGRAAYTRLGVGLVLALGVLVGAGAAPSWAGSRASLTTAHQVASADAVSSVHKGSVPSSTRLSSAAVGPATTPTATPAANDLGQLATETPSGSSHRGLVLVLALVTGGLALLAMARRGRQPRGKDPE